MPRKKIEDQDKAVKTLGISVPIPTLSTYRSLPTVNRKRVQATAQRCIAKAIKQEMGKHLLLLGEAQRKNLENSLT